MTLCIESADMKDAPEIAQILADWVDETPWMPRIHSPEEDRGFGALMIENLAVIVARERQGRVVGFLAREEGNVHALYLPAEKRGQGIGKALLDRAKTEVPMIELWTFQANVGARAFYAREGFVEVESTDGTDNDEKLPDVRLVWKKEAAE